MFLSQSRNIDGQMEDVMFNGVMFNGGTVLTSLEMFGDASTSVSLWDFLHPYLRFISFASHMLQ